MEPNYFLKELDEIKSDIPTNILDIIVTDIDGNNLKLSEYFENKKAILIINVASDCGFTDSNYKQLVSLQEKFSYLQILAFPCNQFAEEEIQCNIDIKKNMKSKYGLNFPMFSKIEVNGEHTHPLYLYLKNNLKEFNINGKLKNIGWNFAKFLLDSSGKIIQYYRPDIDPDSITGDIEKLL